MEQAQFSALIIENQKLIYKVCHMYADLPEDVEDLFQEIVLSLWRAYPNFENKSRLTTWLYKVALNTAITQFRKVKRRQTHEADLNLEFLPTANKVFNEEAHMLYEAMKRLNKVEKALTILYLEDHSYREIAGIMGISENYVGVQLNRIKKKLRDLTAGGSNGFG